MTNEITFWPATIRRNGKILSLAALIQATSRGELGDIPIDWTAGDRFLVGIDPASTERVFIVGPYTITLD